MLVAIKKELRKTLSNMKQPGRVAEYRMGILYAIEVIENEISTIADSVKELVDSEDGVHIDWSRYTDEQLYIIHEQAKADNYDGYEFYDALIELLEE